MSDNFALTFGSSRGSQKLMTDEDRVREAFAACRQALEPVLNCKSHALLYYVMVDFHKELSKCDKLLRSQRGCGIGALDFDYTLDYHNDDQGIKEYDVTAFGIKVGSISCHYQLSDLIIEEWGISNSFWLLNKQEYDDEAPWVEYLERLKKEDTGFENACAVAQKRFALRVRTFLDETDLKQTWW